MESDPIRPTRAREGIYREGTMCHLYEVQIGVPGDPLGGLDYRSKGFRDPRWTQSDPNPTQNWSKNDQFRGPKPRIWSDPM